MTETRRTVTTQAELDQALADGVTEIIIDAPARPVLRVVARGSSRVVARGSSSVEAWGSSRVEAWDSSSVEARDSSSVEAWDSSRVEAWDSSSVEARDSSSVEARDSSSVEARDSSSVEARDSSRVEAWGSSSVEAWGSSSVEARDSSSVEARGSSSVHAKDRSKVVQHTPWTVTTCYGEQIEVTGSGVVVRVPDLTDAATWCAYHGLVPDDDGIVTVYKAVNDQWTTDHGWNYGPGATPVAPDWRPDGCCGGGLHFGPTPNDARAYHIDATRYVACGVALADLRPIVGEGCSPKCKAPRVVRGCVEVDIDGRPVAVAAEVAG